MGRAAEMGWLCFRGLLRAPGGNRGPYGFWWLTEGFLARLVSLGPHLPYSNGPPKPSAEAGERPLAGDRREGLL